MSNFTADIPPELHRQIQRWIYELNFNHDFVTSQRELTIALLSELRSAEDLRERVLRNRARVTTRRSGE
jgi:hypothetical protein